MKRAAAVILAAGKGTRMKSQTPKVLAKILFRPMIQYVVDACKNAGIKEICVVTGYCGDEVKKALNGQEGITFACQTAQLGTGDAVRAALPFLETHQDDAIAVLCGDAPLIDAAVLSDSLAAHQSAQNDVTLLTATVDDPASYGRILRQNGALSGIVEAKDCTEEQLAITEINTGAYWFEGRVLPGLLQKLSNQNAQQEYYLTDTIALAAQAGLRVDAFQTADSDLVLGVNSRKDQLTVSRILNERTINRLLDEGVEFLSTDGVLIAPDAKIGPDTVIYPGTILKEGVVIGNGCTIGPNTTLCRTTVGDGVTLHAVYANDAVVEHDANIGPWAQLRPNTTIGHHVHIGDFVEIKNSSIGAGTAVSHLTYVGDSDVGKNVNFGCGVAVANYDGVRKYRCVIGDGAFIGCNTNLVAPVRVGDNGYTAAGSTITDDVPDEAMGIARARQINKADFSTKKLAGRKKKVEE